MLAGPTWASKQCAWWTILISFGGGRAWSSSFSTSLYPIVQVEGMKRGRRNAYKSDKVPAHHSWSTRNRLKGEQLPRIKIPQRISRLTAINSGPSPLHRASPPTTLFRRYDVPPSIPRECSSFPPSWMFLLRSLVDVPRALFRHSFSKRSWPTTAQPKITYLINPRPSTDVLASTRYIIKEIVLSRAAAYW